MAVNARKFEVDAAIVLLGIALISCVSNGALLRRSKIGLGGHGRRLLDDSTETDGGSTVFNVMDYDAKVDDDNADNAQAFIVAWNAACASSNPAKLVIPEGTFTASPVVFQGPCKSTEPITVDVQGTVKATTDLSEYSSPEWILFERISGLILNGGGTFDGQGAAVWQYNDCKKNKDCQSLPDSIKFSHINNSIIYNITSLNSKYFHMHVTDCSNVTMYSLNITAPNNSPNTDGIHISSSDTVNVSSSTIGTGDDCISIGQGVTNLSVSQITCGPGHGISVGSLGKYDDEKDVSGILVTNCTLTNTTNGARIKTYGRSPPSQASNIIFQDIIVIDVKNPIVIDQKYGSHASKPSQVKISDVHFKNIKGTSTSDVAVSLLCSSLVPCEEVELVDIDLSYSGNGKSSTLSSSCSNVQVTSDGVQNPAACQ